MSHTLLFSPVIEYLSFIGYENALDISAIALAIIEYLKLVGCENFIGILFLYSIEYLNLNK